MKLYKQIMEGVNYKSIWKYFKIRGNVDTCKKCKKILLEEDPSTSKIAKHLNLYHQIDVFDDGKFPACTIPPLHDHFQFGMTATCDYCCKTENYLKVLYEIKIHFIEFFHEKYHLLTTEKMYKVLLRLTLYKVECDFCRTLGIQLFDIHTSIIKHLEVKRPEMLSYHNKISLRRMAMNSTLTNLLITEIEFQNKIQANSQTGCEIKQKTEEHSLTLPINHDMLRNLLKKEIEELQNKIQANSQTGCEIKQKTEEHSETLPIHHDKMSSKRVTTSSTLPNLLRKEIEFQNKTQANSQTGCEIKQKTEGHSETLPIHHDKMSSKRVTTSSTLPNLLRKEVEFQNKTQANSQTGCEIKQKTEGHSETLPIHHDKMSSKRVTTSSTLPNLLRKEVEFQNKTQPNSQTGCEIKQKTEGHSETLPIHHDKMSSKRVTTSSTLPNLLRKEVEFQNKTQANSQTGCKIKQKTEEQSETLPTHHESASNISKLMDSNGWIIIDSQGNEIDNEEKTNDPIDLIDTDWELL